MISVTVVIPVGPFPANQRWLQEAVDSVRAQTHRCEILIVDDQAGLASGSLGPAVTFVYTPTRLGVALAFNAGVAKAATDCVFMLGSDDTLEPDCIEQCVKAYVGLGEPGDTYFFVGVRYNDDREDQFVPCGAAMVTKRLWKATGGFPIEASTGASDAAFISIAMANPKHIKIVGVCESRPLYNYRSHDETDTARLGPWQGVILATRDLVTYLWRPQ